MALGRSWDGSGGLRAWFLVDVWSFWKVYQKLDWSKVRFLNAEWTMLNAEWWMLTLSHSHTLTLSHSHTLTLSHTHTHTLLHTLKRQDWIVLNANIDLFTGNPKQYAHHNNRAPIHFTLKCKWMHSPDKTQDSCTQSPQRIKDLPSFTEKNDGHTKKDMFHHKKERQPNPSASP